MNQVKMQLALPEFRLHDQNLWPRIAAVFKGKYELPLWGYGKTIVDIGAQVGAFSLWASHRWPGSKIYAYESDLDSIARFRLNTSELPSIDLESNPFTPDALKNPKFTQNVDILKIDLSGAEAAILATLINGAGASYGAILIDWYSEEARRRCDALLHGYTLIGAFTREIGTGYSKYLRNKT